MGYYWFNREKILKDAWNKIIMTEVNKNLGSIMPLTKKF